MKKTKRAQTRLSERLRERFEESLEYEGITESDFLTGKIIEFVEVTEKKWRDTKCTGTNTD